MDILLKPIVTEKMTMQGETLNRYGFIVDKRANKIQIKSAIEEMYGVSVEDVNTIPSFYFWNIDDVIKHSRFTWRDVEC